MEASFCGADFGKYADLHFNTTILQELGQHFAEAIIEYMQVDQKKIKTIITQIEELMSDQTKNDRAAQIQLENDLKQQLGLLGN